MDFHVALVTCWRTPTRSPVHVPARDPRPTRIELGDDLYAPVALAGAALVVVVLTAVPRLLVSLDDGTIKDRARLALYQRHLFASLWAALPRELAERAAAWERGFSEERCYLGHELAQELRGGAPMIEYHPDREAWLVDEWPDGVSLPPMLQPRRTAARQLKVPPMAPPCPSPCKCSVQVAPPRRPSTECVQSNRCDQARLVRKE